MATLLPNGKQRFVDANGDSLAGGEVSFYLPGTTTRKDTYQDAGRTISNANPVLLDARGEATIWGTGPYRQVVVDALGAVIWDEYIEDTGYAVSQQLVDYAKLEDIAVPMSSYAALRSYTDTRNRGVRITTAGIAGIFMMDPVDISSVDNGGTIIVDAASRRWKRISDNPAVNVRWFGASPTSTDNTAAIQAAFNYAIVSGIKAVYIPQVYKITGTITLGTSTAVDLTGLAVSGDSIGGSGITQMTDNIPMFLYTGRYIHTNRWHDLFLKFNTMQTGNASAAIFRINGISSGSFYNCTFSNMMVNNFYYFMDAPTILWWGNTYSDIWFANFAYGINRVTGAAGEPNCRFEKLYISCENAVGVLFTHNAMMARYDSIEVNGALSGALMLYDGGGGTHIISAWRIEVGTYSANATLFNVPNSKIIGDYSEISTLTIPVGVNVTCYATNGPGGLIDLRVHNVPGVAAVLGTLDVLLVGAPARGEVGRIVGAALTANYRLTNITATVAANNVAVTEWNNNSRIAMISDTDVTLTYDAPVHQIYNDELTANRSITMAEDRIIAGNQLFSGRRHRISKPNTSAFTVIVKSAAGSTLATLPSGSKGFVEMVWQRTLTTPAFSWVIIGSGTF
jgi:hypothetical protein